MLKACYLPYTLHFKEPGGTSRGVMTIRKVWYLFIYDDLHPEIVGIGECAPLPGLSCDDPGSYEEMLQRICANIRFYAENPISLEDYPSIRFGLEIAWRDYIRGGKRIWFPSDFTDGYAGIQINGLIWMGDSGQMIRRIKQKLEAGFSCLKLKIGAIDFEEEYALLKKLRDTFSLRDLELRVDANGAFRYEEALEKMDRLAALQIHSIEQPIKAGQWEKMAALCCRTSLPIALDEELIGIHSLEQRRSMLDIISPQYIILKPSLVGGFESTDEWIRLAEERKKGWWITSALESNIGLNALAQWCFLKQNPLPQGLGTGKVFTNNIPSRLRLAGELLYFNPNGADPKDYDFLQHALTS